MNSIDFSGKVALVTGGASGIGLACARTFIRSGARVVIADRQRELGEQAAAELVELARTVGPAVAGAPIPDARFVEVDVSDPPSTQRMVERCLEHYGRLDCAVNSAGITGKRLPASEYDLAHWKQVIDINLNGVFFSMRAELPVMLKQGSGAIVNLASILGSVAVAGSSAYTASKHAVVGLTKAAALDHAKQGVRINAVGPGYIDTPLITMVTGDPQNNARITGLHPMGRLGQPQEMANLIVFLCSEQASFMTGGYYVADGGYVAQ